MSQLDLIQSLTSPHYSVRSKGLVEFYECRDLVVLQKISKWIEETPKNEHSFIFVNLLTDILNEVHETLTSWSLLQLFSFVTKERTPISKIAYNAIETFFASPDVYNHFKSFVISNSWNKMSVEHKLVMTKLIRKNRFPHHSRLLVSNFEVSNPELQLESIRALRSLNDRRGNRVVMSFLESNNLELKKEAIITIGFTGNLFDGFALIPHLESHEREIAVEAMTSCQKLIGNFARKHIWRVFNKTTSKRVKVAAIRQLSFMTTKAAFKNLLDAYIIETDSYLRLEIEQSLSKIKFKNRDDLVLKYLRSMSLEQQCIHLGVLDSFNTDKIASFLCRLIDGSKDDRIIAISYNLLSRYQQENVLEFLNSKLEDSSVYSFWAYDALLKIRFKQSAHELLESPPVRFSIDQPHHGLYVKYVSKVAINTEAPLDIAEYLAALLRSENLDIVYLSLSCLRLAHNKSSIFTLLDEYAGSIDEYYQDSILNTIRTILYRSSPFIDHDIIAQLPDEVYKELNPFLISVELLGKLLRYLAQGENPFLVDFLGLNKSFLRDKCSTIILEEEDDLACFDLFRVTTHIGMMLTGDTDKRLKKIYFEHDYSRKDILSYFLAKRQKEDFDFIISQYSSIPKFELISELNEFTEAVL